MSLFPFDAAGIGRQIQAYLRAHATRREDHERIGPFLASFDGDNPNPYLNYAVPEDGALPEAREIEDLIAAFARRGRRPRLEYIAQAAPAVEPALLAAGFTIERRFPLLVCVSEMLKEAPVVDVEIACAHRNADVADAVDVGTEAYGEPHGPEPLRRMLDQGGVLMIARDRQSGAAVGAGMATPAHEGVSEVAGIGVRVAFRRRGIAAALTSAIAREAFARGVTLAWLTPGHDGAERIYRRAGFVRATEQLHISKTLTA